MPRRTTGKATGPQFLSRLTVSQRASGTPRKEQPVIKVEGLETYGAFRYIEQEIHDGFLPVYGGPIKEQIFAHYITEGVAIGRCPQNFKGSDGLVDEASLQMRRKDSRFKLKSEDAERFRARGIRLGEDNRRTIKVKEEVFAANQKLMDEMLGCLARNGFDVAEIFEIEEHNGGWIVGEETLNDLFKKAKEAREKGMPFSDAELRDLTELCVTPSIGTKWEGTFAEAFAIVSNIVCPAQVEEKKPGKQKAA